jgi:hypothetical protein
VYPIPVEKRIALLKETYPEVIIYETRDLGKSSKPLYVCARVLTFSEFNHLQPLYVRDQQAAEEYVFDSCYDSTYSTEHKKFIKKLDLPGAIPKQVVQFIVEGSGFSDPESLLYSISDFRGMLPLVEMQSMCFIMKAFPNYKLRDLKQLTLNEIAELIVMSEYLLNTEFQISTGNEKGEEQENKELHDKIHREAKMHDKYLSFDDMSSDNQHLTEN